MYLLTRDVNVSVLFINRKLMITHLHFIWLLRWLPSHGHCHNLHPFECTSIKFVPLDYPGLVVHIFVHVQYKIQSRLQQLIVAAGVKKWWPSKNVAGWHFTIWSCLIDQASRVGADVVARERCTLVSYKIRRLVVLSISWSSFNSC